MDIEFELFSSLFKGFLVNYDFISIDEVLFQLVRKDSLNGIHCVGITYFLDGLGDLSVSISRLDDSQGSLGRFIGS